jgi:hypothetical protein
LSNSPALADGAASADSLTDFSTNFVDMSPYCRFPPSNAPVCHKSRFLTQTHTAVNLQAQPIGPIPLGDAPQGAMQGPRYTTFEKLKAATKVADLVGKK